jgi:DNA modification methylase
MSLFDESIDHTPLDVVSSVDDNLSLQYPSQYERNGIHIFQGDSLNIYNNWPSPVAIISDGPYGISGFSGDLAIRCEHGVTNVWHEPAVRNSERLKQGQKALHTNQKPLCLNELIIRLCTDENDVVWEPFGGLCTAAIASYRLGRRCFSAEIEPQFYNVAISRLDHYN